MKKKIFERLIEMYFKRDYTPIDEISFELSDSIIEKYFENQNYEADSIFKYNTSIKNTAYLNWRVNDFYSEWRQLITMGYAYLDASINLLILILKEGNKYNQADSLIFPILFDAIHGIELYLKGLIRGLQKVIPVDKPVDPWGHDIRKLSVDIKKHTLLFSEKYLNEKMTKEFNRMSTLVGELIDNIYIETDDMTFPRYPSRVKKKKSIPHFYVKERENVTVDLELLLEQILVIFYIFNYMETVVLEVMEHNKEIDN